MLSTSMLAMESGMGPVEGGGWPAAVPGGDVGCWSGLSGRVGGGRA